MKKFLLIFLLQINLAHSIEAVCDFEEVYSNSQTQQGLFILKNEKMRYEYFDKKLFTIIAKNEKFYLINQTHKNNVSKIDKNTEILEILLSIASEYPDLKSSYNYSNIKIIIEKSSNNFIKRVSINSEDVNVSINLMNCKFESINDKYFNHFNFEKFVR